MEIYEIRVVPREGGTKVYTSTYLNDYAAMRGARLLAADDERIEIWRGMHCLYQGRPEKPGPA